MVSTGAVAIFVCALAAILIFVIWCIRHEKLHLMHRLYLALALCYAAWVIPLIAMHFVNPADTRIMFFLDCCTSPGGLLSSGVYLCIAIAFVKGWDRLPAKAWYLFLVPLAGVIVAFTNPWHHLQYRVFSTVKDEIVFGPFVNVTGAYSYFCLIVGMITMIRFAWKNKSRLYLVQCVLFSIGGMFPMIVSAVATFSAASLPITATPISFLVPILMHGYAIYQMHFLDIRPIATRHILDWISDCYLVLSANGLVITYNKQFAAIFTSKYGISENRYLHDCVKEDDISKKTAVFNMITAVQSSEESESVVSYEQAMHIQEGETVRKIYYMVEVSPLFIDDRIEGFVLSFKEVTKLRESLHQLQESRQRMMEQERLAFLGQMIGGLAHNLKTPIMSVSGGLAALDALVEECENSLGDPVVTEDDFREIYAEQREWSQKLREAMTYMSDIITAIKGQASSVMEEDTVFDLEEALNRCSLLMRHELLSGQCRMEVRYEDERRFALVGNINNLVQCLNNLLSNAIFAQQQVGGGIIYADVGADMEQLHIKITDTGPGVSRKVRDKLFKTMVTSKGAKGTGLGLYISNVLIRGRFDGSIYMEDNPEGGAIFSIAIPMERVTVSVREKGEDIGEKA